MGKTITVSLSDSQYKVLKKIAAFEDESVKQFSTGAVTGVLESFVDMYFDIHHPRRKEMMEAMRQ